MGKQVPMPTTVPDRSARDGVDAGEQGKRQSLVHTCLLRSCLPCLDEVSICREILVVRSMRGSG